MCEYFNGSENDLSRMNVDQKKAKQNSKKIICSMIIVTSKFHDAMNTISVNI
jgi:hypothetical protein